MKRFALLCLLLVLAAPMARAEGAAFSIDDANTYDMMSRPYAQGYVPRIEGDTAYVVLPLTSDICVGDITAEFWPDDLSVSPVKLKNDFDQIVKRKQYTFSGEKVSAYKVYFKLSLHASRRNGEYPCAIRVNGKDAAGNALSQTFPVMLRVSGARGNDEAPDVRIESFDAGAALNVGDAGVLTMRVANKSATREARDVAVVMADATGDILPDGSDTVMIGTLAPGESASASIPVRALNKASAQPHAVEFKLSYGYAENKTAAKSEKRTVDVRQAVRLNHTEAALPVRVTQGENVQFNLTLMNMGKGTLYNALLTFDIPHMAAGGSVLAGTIEPGKSAASTANLRVAGDYDGETSGTLTLTWEDGYGVFYEKALPLSTTVLKKAAPVSAAGAILPGTDGANSAQPAPREMAAWGAAAMCLALFSIGMIRSSRKIRKLEEGKL